VRNRKKKREERGKTDRDGDRERDTETQPEREKIEIKDGNRLKRKVFSGSWRTKMRRRMGRKKTAKEWGGSQVD